MSVIVDSLRAALKADPANWQTRAGLVEALVQEERLDEAAAVLNEVGELPADLAARAKAARAYGLFEPANGIEILDGILAEDGSQPNAHIEKAFLAHRAGDLEVARRHYFTATTLDPSLANASLEAAVSGNGSGSSGGELAPAQPAAGPVAPVDEAPPIRPLVNPADAPERHDLAYERQPTQREPVHTTRQEALAHLHNVQVQPKTSQPLVTYDYQHPDDAMFEPEHGPEDFAVPAAGGERGDELVAALEERRLELERQVAIGKRNDKIKAVTTSIALTAGLLLLMSLVVMSLPQPPAPEIVAVAQSSAPSNDMRTKKLDKPQVKPQQVTQPAPSMDIVTAFDSSSVAMASSSQPSTFGIGASAGVDFGASMSFGMGAGVGQGMLFGQPMEGKVLGVILDVSGSMAEFLPQVIREIDRNFSKSPIVYVRSATIEQPVSDAVVQRILPEEFVPTRNGKSTEYGFFWWDLPRKATPDAVERLRSMIKTRENGFLAVGRRDPVAAAVDFLISQKIDSLYLFSDFVDPVLEDPGSELAKRLRRAGVKVYAQSPSTVTEYGKVVSQEMCKSTRGRMLPPLEDLRGTVGPDPVVDMAVVEYAAARDTMLPPSPRPFWMDRPPHGDREEIGRVSRREFDVVFYGPDAVALIYLKNEEGRYIRTPIRFVYQSGKNVSGDYIPLRHVSNREVPLLGDDNVTWLMNMEEGVEFDVSLTVTDSGLEATCNWKDNGLRGAGHGIWFSVPQLAHTERDSATYHSFDFPGGLSLDEMRQVVAKNTVVLGLPRSQEDAWGVEWEKLGLKRGKNELPMNQLIRSMPRGLEKAEVFGPSWGPRRLTFERDRRDQSLGSYIRADSEFWEGFRFSLSRNEGQPRSWALIMTIE